jgi:hypothetical protein
MIVALDLRCPNGRFAIDIAGERLGDTDLRQCRVRGF